MCGIVGVMGFSLHKKHEDMFKTLLYLDTIRGPDSTGIIGVSKAKEVFVAKNLGTPWDFLQSRPALRVFGQILQVLIGHNRWATQGRVNKLNAHPFEFETVVGVHNGTLRRQSLLPDWGEFEVDSENIFHSMDIQGVKKTVNNLNGAYALVWWDKVNNRLHFIRNDERPLFYAFSKDRKILMWASEPYMIRIAAQKNSVDISDVVNTTKDSLYTFEIPKDYASVFAKPRKKPMKGYIFAISEVSDYISGWGRDAAFTKREKRQAELSLVQRDRGVWVPSDDDDLLTIDGFNMERLNYSQFKARTNELCAVCTGDIEFLEKDLYWFDSMSCVCPECVAHTDEGEAFIDFAEMVRWGMGTINKI